MGQIHASISSGITAIMINELLNQSRKMKPLFLIDTPHAHKFNNLPSTFDSVPGHTSKIISFEKKLN